MNRRNFIKTGSLLLAIPAILPVSEKLSRILINKINVNKFSLNVIAPTADEAVPVLQNFINSLELKDNIVQYSEYMLSGVYKSDLTFTENNRLLNYKSAGSELSDKLNELHDKLNLSAELKNPVLIKMYNYNFEKAKELYVYKSDIIQQKITLSDDERFYTIKGNNGDLTLEVKNFKAKIINSSCAHKTCMKMNAAHYSGDSLICIPNRISIVAI
jgi:hypothetical protein